MRPVALLALGFTTGCAAAPVATPPVPAPVEVRAAPETPAAPAPCYHIVAKHSGLPLGIREGRSEEGADAIQWTETGSDEQRFEIVAADRGNVRLRAVHSGRYLAVAGGATHNAARVVQTADASAPSAQWVLVPVRGDWFRVLSAHSEQSLAVSARETGRGSLIIQWPGYDGDEQLWCFVLSPRMR
jgi:cytochrome c